LSPEEARRADELRRHVDRERFVAARGWQRRLIAAELGCDPREVPIVIGVGGKPTVQGSNLRFSAARSASLALYATSWWTDVGVDIEAIRKDAAIEDIARRFFSPAEQLGLASLSPPRRLTASFQCWTAKEAYAKGIGSGLTFPLQSIDTWRADGRPVTVSGWMIHQVDVGIEYAAAVAGRGLEGWVPAVPRRVGSPNSGPSTGTIERSSEGVLGGLLEE
jgi:4'-phosphopantetheinyl transferase